MEPIWSPVVATGGNQRQIGSARKPRNEAETVALGCDRLPEAAHGQEGVDSGTVLLAEVAHNWRALSDLQGLSLESRLREPALSQLS
jgi:hypothetical protein